MINTEAKNEWFVQLSKSTEAKLYLYCFPFAGGSSNVFRRWPLFVPAGVEVVPVEIPGHGKRLQEQPFSNLFELVEKMGAEIGAMLRQPFAFLGHSMGALLAFELTRFLRRQKLPMPRQLFVSAHVAPHTPSLREPIYGLPEKEFIARLQEINGTPQQVLQNDELRALFLPILRSDFKLCETYEYKESLTFDFPITAFCGDADADVEPQHMEAWSTHTMSMFNMHVVSGDHFFIQSAEQEFFHILRKELNTLINKL